MLAFPGGNATADAWEKRFWFWNAPQVSRTCQTDCDAGRKKAREFLQKQVSDQAGTNLGPTRYSFPPFVPVQVTIPKTAKDLEEDLRQEFRDRVYARAKDMLTAAGITGVPHWFVCTFYLSSKLDELFGL